MNAGLAHHQVWTDDDLLSLPKAKFWQLSDGELIKLSPAGAEHGLDLAGTLKGDPVLPGLVLPMREVSEDPIFEG